MFVYENRDLFIPAHRLPIVSVAATLRAAFLAMNDFGVGGLIAADGDLPLYAVGAGILRDFFRAAAERQDVALAAMTSLGSAITALMHPEFRRPAASEDIGLMSIAPRAVTVMDEIAGLGLAEGHVYAVGDQTARRVGWLVTNSRAMQMILTPKPHETEFVCEAGHKNKDADSGYCSFCPKKLKP